MKLNTLATAVSISLAALTLTACGSDNDGGATVATTPSTNNNAADQAANAAEAEAKRQEAIKALTAAFVGAGLTQDEAAKLAAANPTVIAGSQEFQTLLAAAQAAKQANIPANSPNQGTITDTNVTVDGYDPVSDTTTVGFHYARSNDSNFDRVANKSAVTTGNAGITTNISLTVPENGNIPNPYLSNFIVGTELDPTNNRIYARNSLGEDAVDATPTDPKTTLGNKVTTTLYREGDYKTDTQDSISKKEFTVSQSGIKTIQEVNTNNVNVAADDDTKAVDAAKTVTVNNSLGNSGLIVHSAKRTTDGISDVKLLAGLEENTYEYDTDDDSNLIVKNAVTGTKATYGTNERDVANNKTTRVFGKNYNALLAGATGLQRANGTESGAIVNNTYTATLKTTGTGATKVSRVEIKDDVLHNVQYGRLTANVDALTEAPQKDKSTLVYRDFQQHGAPSTVDFYFYRGTNETSIDEMAKVKAAGGELEYNGHALTYGVAPVLATAGNGLPNAYSSVDQATIGNFVQAKYNTATNQVNGSIYNFINTNRSANNENFERQDLITFTGNVAGNTVVGTSTKLGATAETGNFNAAFYGKQAEELGGQVSSITRENGYGLAKWGAVFGAKRTITTTGGNVVTGQAGTQNP